MRQRFQRHIGHRVVAESRIEANAQRVLFALKAFWTLLGDEQCDLVTLLVAHEVQQIGKDIDERLLVRNFFRVQTRLHFDGKVVHALNGNRTLSAVSKFINKLYIMLTNLQRIVAISVHLLVENGVQLTVRLGRLDFLLQFLDVDQIADTVFHLQSGLLNAFVGFRIARGLFALLLQHFDDVVLRWEGGCVDV